MKQMTKQTIMLHKYGTRNQSLGPEPHIITEQGPKLGFLELHHATSEAVQRLIGNMVPILIQRQPYHIVQWKTQKLLQFLFCEILSEILLFGSSYVMDILCVIRRPYSYLHEWVHMAD